MVFLALALTGAVSSSLGNRPAGQQADAVPSPSPTCQDVLPTSGELSATGGLCEILPTPTPLPTPSILPSPLSSLLPVPHPVPKPVSHPVGGGGSWPQWMFDAAHTGFNPAETLITPANVQLLRQGFESNGSASGREGIGSNGWYSPVGLARGMIFGGGDDRLLAMTDDKTCTPNPNSVPGHSSCYVSWYAGPVPAHAGREWGPQLMTAPAVSGGDVYSTRRNGDLAVFAAAGCGQLQCQAKWIGHTDELIMAPPTLADGVVYVATSQETGGSEARLYAFDARGCGAAMCQALWTSTPNPTSVDWAAPTVGGGLVFSGAAAFPQHGCGAPVCAPRWRLNVDSGPTTYANNTLFMCTTGGEVAIDPQTGATKWTAPLTGQGSAKVCWTQSASAYGKVFVSGFDGALNVIDAATGTRLWTAPVGAAEPNGMGYGDVPTIANHMVFIGGTNQEINVFDVDGCGNQVCQPLAAFPPHQLHPAAGAITIAGGRIYFGQLVEYELPGD
jgi:outer membrane protein assembly factor BamB